MPLTSLGSPHVVKLVTNQSRLPSHNQQSFLYVGISQGVILALTTQTSFYHPYFRHFIHFKHQKLFCSTFDTNIAASSL